LIELAGCINDRTLVIHDEGRAHCDLFDFVEDSIFACQLAVFIGDQRITEPAQFADPALMGFGVIDAGSDYARMLGLESGLRLMKADPPSVGQMKENRADKKTARPSLNGFR